MICSNALSPSFKSGLLPWEDEDDLCDMVREWRAAFKPDCPAEHALVDQLIWIRWRRQRLILAERALHMAQLNARSSTTTAHGSSDGLVRRSLTHMPYRLRKYDSQTAVSTTSHDDGELAEFARLAEERAHAALAIIAQDGLMGDAAAYLEEDTLEWWEDERADNPDRYAETVEGLKAFIEIKLLSWLKGLQKQAGEREYVRLQAYGESLDPVRANTLLTLDDRLTRQFEKAMGMLIKLQDRRANSPSALELPPA